MRVSVSITLLLLMVCMGCAGDPAHRDCDRRLVPINVLQTELETAGELDPTAGRAGRKVSTRSE